MMAYGSWLMGGYDGGLGAALSDLRLRELPPQYKDGDGFWLRALVCVSKRNLTVGWCVAERDAHGAVRYTKDYGMPSPMIGVVSMHPFEYLEEDRYGELYGSEEDMRHRLALYYQQREVALSLSYVGDEEKLARLRDFTQRRVEMCKECKEADLAWLDRERMILSQREDEAVVACREPEETAVEETATKGEEKDLKQATPKRKRGRPRKR